MSDGQGDERGFWDRRSGHVLRWIAVPLAGVAGLLLGQILGGVNSYLVRDALPIPESWQPTLSRVLGFYFGPMVWVLAPAWVAPKGSKIVAIVFGTIIATTIAAGTLLGALGVVVSAYSGLQEVLYLGLGAVGIATGIGLGFGIAEERAGN